jgi:tRNA (uracil-5-)-methyltransferase
VLATEVSKSSVQAADYNLEANGVSNVTMVRMSSDEISDALAGGREYRRMQGVDLASYNFTTLFVDPPRMGLDDATWLARRFPTSSTSPATRPPCATTWRPSRPPRDQGGGRVRPVSLHPHLECGLLLSRRPAA